MSPAPASPVKILIMHTQEQIQRRPIYSPNRHDKCMDNKIYSESFIENILPTKYLYGRNQCQVQFYKPFSSLQLNWDMKCILIG